MSHSRSQGTEVTIVTGDVFPTDDDYVDGAKDADLIKCSSTTDGNGRAHTEKHDILLSFKKNQLQLSDTTFFSF